MKGQGFHGLPGDPDDMHALYLEAAIDDVLVGGGYASAIPRSPQLPVCGRAESRAA